MCTRSLHSLAALTHCTHSLHSLTALTHCTHSLHSLTALTHCTHSLHSLTALTRCTHSLHSLTALTHCTHSLHSLTALTRCSHSLHSLTALTHCTHSLHSLTALDDCSHHHFRCSLAHCTRSPSYPQYLCFDEKDVLFYFILFFNVFLHTSCTLTHVCSLQGFFFSAIVLLPAASPSRASICYDILAHEKHNDSFQARCQIVRTFLHTEAQFYDSLTPRLIPYTARKVVPGVDTARSCTRHPCSPR
jgi:hypothetical protein